MKTLKTVIKKCPYCDNTHEVHLIQRKSLTEYKGVKLYYNDQSYYCNKTGAYWDDEELMKTNSNTIKENYKKIKGEN